MQDDGLPRLLAKSRNDAVADALDSVIARNERSERRSNL